MVQCHFFAFHYLDALRRMIQQSVLVHAYIQNVYIICNPSFVYDKMTDICMYGYTKLIKFSVYPCVREREYR